MRKSSRRNSGFTLIELMVSIAIIAILVAVSLPRFVNARYRGYLSACLLNERNIATALTSYQTDFTGFPPTLNHLVQASYGGHISALPTCPSGPGQAYVYEVSPTYEAFTLVCPGYHEHQIPGMPDGFPQYQSASGLAERP